MKDTMAYIETEKAKYPIVFNLNVLEEIQDKYGSLDAWGKVTRSDGEPNVKDLKVGIMLMINEGNVPRLLYLWLCQSDCL